MSYLCSWLSLAYISYVSVCSASHTVILWNSTFITDATGWVLSGGAVKSDERCPGASSCYELQANDTISRTTSTIGYHSVQLTMQMQTEALSQSQQCQIWYHSKDTVQNVSVKLVDAAHVFHVHLPTTATNNTAIRITVVLKGVGAEGRCRINNAYLSGIPITKASILRNNSTLSSIITSSEPTLNPTLKPTINIYIAPTVLSTSSMVSNIASVTNSSSRILKTSGAKYQSTVGKLVFVICILLSIMMLCLCGYFLFTMYQYLDEEQDRKKKECNASTTKKFNIRMPSDFTMEDYSTITPTSPDNTDNNGVFVGKYKLGTPTRNKRTKFRAIDSESRIPSMQMDLEKTFDSDYNSDK